ncbi:tol-pal system-associated acyl-CoA thioesterase [Spongiibacter sp. IMCC21906]|uniref:tol-pal system-associated acyl-CoA thioesterase n=1 Tax=Spongiibacter sp. IMCC21906 TaxID=1620392 RepID=UPI00062E095C|nr:tol-pal system-associated acyl-CoA thioesterase [Spongiibacter sp. IMCC21906]AKH70401.1 tol-pal system-associated acyl-CoA thioesterase [Spongiibacter sp. IMCC21906]
MSVFQFPVRVYIEDTDAGGIVYYVNYLKFIERARTECFRALGFDKAAIFDDALMFVVSGMTVKYLHAAKLDDELVVTATVTTVARVRLEFEQDIYRDGTKLFTAKVQVACVDRVSHKPKRIPETLLTALAESSEKGS